MLVVGGQAAVQYSAKRQYSAERLNLATGVWQATGPLQRPSTHHDALLLDDGRVAIVGGDSPEIALYDPRANGFGAAAPSPLGPEPQGVGPAFRGIILVTGEILVVTVAHAALYNPRLDSWRMTAPKAVRAFGGLVRLHDGRVMALGGMQQLAPDYFAASNVVGIYDPASDQWEFGPLLRDARDGFTATVLRDGRVLVLGGTTAPGSPGNAEMYDPVQRRWQAVSPMSLGRSGHHAFLLPDGRVLALGGQVQSSRTPMAVEVYDPGTDRWQLLANLGGGREGMTATLLPSGQIVLTGGVEPGQTDSNQAVDVYTIAVQTASREGQPTEVKVSYSPEECRGG
ncbi:MAG: kelch repeat-containing protein [Chloroflexia bacterium]